MAPADFHTLLRFFKVLANENRLKLVGICRPLKWAGLKSFVQVDRIGLRLGRRYQQTNYYISSLSACATQFAQIIRGHWGIENRLHWVKDVVFQEDAAPFRHHNAASNWSLIRNIAINIARYNGYDSLTKAERFLAHDIDQLFFLLE